MIVLDDAKPFEEIRGDELGIPFHITLLFPFAPREQLTEDVLADLRSFFAAQPPLEFELTRVAMWPDVVYAVPEPDAELRACMSALFERFPQYPPYGGVHPEVVPHATLAEEVEAARVADDIARRVAPHLPKRYRIDAATLLEEFAPARWRERERFPLGGQRP